MLKTALITVFPGKLNYFQSWKNTSNPTTQNCNDDNKFSATILMMALVWGTGRERDRERR